MGQRINRKPSKEGKSTVVLGSSEKAKRAKAATKPTAKRGKNFKFWSDDKLIGFIETHAKEFKTYSQSAGKDSIEALRRYILIGTELLDQKELGKFSKPNMSIKDFCNTHLVGIVGDTNPYSMCGLCMTFAKPGKGNQRGMWETFSDHVEAMEKVGTPVEPMGINAAMACARKLMRGEAADTAKPKVSKSDRLAEAERRLGVYQQLATEMLSALPADARDEFTARIAELDATDSVVGASDADDHPEERAFEGDEDEKLAAD